MPGFPTRPSRAAFGPVTLSNRFTPKNDNQFIGADKFMLAWWQLAGLGLTTDLAWCLFTGATPPVLQSSAEAWDPSGASLPTIARLSTGVFTVTYASTYLDEAGNEIALNLLAGKAYPQGSAANYVAVVERLSGVSFKIRVTVANTAGAVDPAALLVELK